MNRFKSALIIGFGLFTSHGAFAVHVTIQDPCAPLPWLEVDTLNYQALSVGAVTVASLKQADLAYQGDAQSILSIQNSPVGDAALELVADDEMKAYGWCYQFNGVEPGLYADEVPVLSATDRITWFFAYAHYKRGEWIAMCVPTHLDPPPFICGTAD